MFSKIVLCCDFLMTRPETQRHHLRWFSTILNTALKKATRVPVANYLSDEEDAFSRKDFFAQSNIKLAETESHFYFDPEAITDASINTLKKTLGTDLLIGYELSEETRRILCNADITYIDIWLHPIRFLEDNFFAYKSNSEAINARLAPYHLQEELYQLYADKLKIQSYMGWDKYKNLLDSSLKKNSALFVGQTLTDKAVCRNGTMLNVLNFKEKFTELTKNFDHVYFSRHPLIRGDDTEQLDFVLSHNNTSITTEPGYKLLCTESVQHVTGISSSLMYESKFFGKSYDYLFRPVLEIKSEETPNGYYSVFSKLHSPAFWRSALQDIIQTNDEVVEYDFLTANSNYRDMLSLYYNTHVFDKAHASFIRTPNSNNDKKSHTPKLPTKLQANPPSLKKLQAAIDKHQIISFDVFDTLLQRRSYIPGDVISLTALKANAAFDIPPEKFTTARREAKQHSIKHEVPLLERYEIVGKLLQLDERTWTKLYEFELEVERGLLEERTIGKIAFDYAKSKGKRVIITSDTYFDKETIKEFLDRAEMVPDAYYVSSEYNKTKEEGSLYDVLIEHEYGSILHVGDNYKADIINSQRKNIDCAWVVSNHEQFKNSISKIILSQGMYGNIRNGIIQKAITQYPAITSSPGYTSGKPFNLGHNIVGDIMLAFAAWIVNQAESDGVETLFFLARDGEIVKKIVDELLDKRNPGHIKTQYLLASRRCLRVASMLTRQDVENEIDLVIIEHKKNPNRSDLEQYLSLRFGLTINTLNELGIQQVSKSINSSSEKTEFPELESWLKSDEVASEILNNSRIERALYLRYLDEVGLSPSDTPIGIVDIGHNGSLQASLAKARGLENTRGYYFCTYDAVDETISKHKGTHLAAGFYRDRISTTDRTQKYIRYALLIESLFLNDKGTFLRFKTEGETLEPTFLEGKEDYRIEFNKNIHAGALEYSKEVLDTIESCLGEIDLQELWIHDDVCARLFSMFENPTFRDAESFSGVTLENYFAGRPLRYFVPPKTQANKTPGIWKEGTSVLKVGLESLQAAAIAKKHAVVKPAKPKARVDVHRQFIDLHASANSLFHRKKYSEAAKAFCDAFKLNPEKPNLLRAASESYFLANDQDSALSTLAKARTLMPKNRKLKMRILTIKYPFLSRIIGENRYCLPLAK